MTTVWPPQCSTHPFDLPLPEPREDSRPVTGPPDPNDDGYDDEECPF